MRATLHTPIPGETLDCGHVAPVLPTGHVGGTGYARRASDNATMCYDCAHWAEVEALKTAERFTAYLTQDPRPIPSHYTVTTWHGSRLMTVQSVSVARSGFRDASGRRPERFTVHATDVHGQKWIGVGPGPGMYLRLRRSRAKR